MPAKIPLEELSFSPFEYNDDILSLDCRELDDSDPLGVHAFIHKDAIKLHNANITTIYVVRHKNIIVACFTLSMFVIKAQRLTDEDRVKDLSFSSYPAILLGQMCVDKQYRGCDIGKHIVKFALGVAKNVNRRVACMCLVAHTNMDKTNYYINKCGFKKAKEEPTDRTSWLYKRVV